MNFFASDNGFPTLFTNHKWGFTRLDNPDGSPIARIGRFCDESGAVVAGMMRATTPDDSRGVDMHEAAAQEWIVSMTIAAAFKFGGYNTRECRPE